MKTYYAKDHDHVYPVGVASVVVAEGVQQARDILDARLIAGGLKPSSEVPYTLVEVHPNEAVVICDGNY